MPDAASVPADGAPRRAAVLGVPIAHSLSPVLHRAAYAALGLSWSYDAHEVDERSLPGFLAGLDATWVGLSLTMPLKRAVLPLLATATPLVRAVGAANTVLAVPGGAGRQWHGENTDVPGLVAALRAAGVGRAPAAVVLGAGATACSALAALRELGMTEPTVLARDPARTADLAAAAARLGVSYRLAPWGRTGGGAGADTLGVDRAVTDLEAAELVVATTPAGSTDALATRLPSHLDGLLVDVTYAPWPTPLATAWQARGGHVVGGFELLLHQAVRQVELMTGQVAPQAAMRAAGEAALARRPAAAVDGGTAVRARAPTLP